MADDRIVFKAVAQEPGSGLRYVMSDDSVDRMGEVIEASGWDLSRFAGNPMLLFNHDKNAPLGRWRDVRVEGNRLVGRAEFAKAGTSARIDEIRSLAEQGLLPAVSVGFIPLAARPMEKGGDASGPRRYVKAELLECSLVTIPANPNALQLAKSLHISQKTIDEVFGKPAGMDDRTVVRGTPLGKTAATPSHSGKTPMSLSERIVEMQADLTAWGDRLEELSSADDLNEAEIDKLNVLIEDGRASLATLQRTEANLGRGGSGTAVVPFKERAAPAAPAVSRRPLNMPRKEIAPADYVLRAHVVNALSKIQQRPRSEIMMERYGDDEVTQKVYQVVTRAASAPATTTGAGWADTLVQTAVADFIDSLTAASVFPGLSSRGIRTGFGRSGSMTFPTRSSTPASVAGAFVAQGAPIPVKQALLAPITLGIKKLGVITTFTREIAEHSTPDIEGILRRFITEDTSAAIDAVLVSNTAATAIAPAGIRNGVSTTTATAGGGFAALVGDVKGLQTALVTASNGNLRSPVWLMNPIQATSIALTQNAGGDFVFAGQINGGTLGGYPVLQSTTITAGMIILVDAADFISLTGDDMRFDVSDQATIHMEDTTPLPIATGAQGSGVLATPTRSLWQTDSLGLRMTMDLNWALLRTGTVAWTSSVTW
jgi:HK97 family phage major capsid protein/HK97 family phage prohead protease